MMVSGWPACAAARARGNDRLWAGAGGHWSAAAAVPGGRASAARHSRAVKKPRIVPKWRKRQRVTRAKSLIEALVQGGSVMRHAGGGVGGFIHAPRCAEWDGVGHRHGWRLWLIQ